MTSQPSSMPTVDFSITTPFKNVRLMEVSNEVLDAIASPSTNGKAPKLTFKSSPPPISTTTLSGNFSAAKSNDSILHLCSEDKVWAVKQVSTSNSVYIIQPTPSNSNLSSEHQNGGIQTDDDEAVNMNDDSSAIQKSRGTVSAIAQVKNFLELQPMKVDEEELKQMIVRFVPTYDPPDLTDLEPPNQSQLREPISLSILKSNIPAPDKIIENLCAKLCLFPHPVERASCYIPSLTAQLQTWSRLMESCSIESLPLDQNINTDQIINALTEDIDKAIATAMLGPGGMFDLLELTEFKPSTSDGTPSCRTLKPVETSAHIATLILNSKPASSPRQITSNTLMTEWTSLVPTAFVKYCTIQSLMAKNLVSSLSSSSEDTDTDVDMRVDEGGNELLTWSEGLAATAGPSAEGSRPEVAAVDAKDGTAKSAATAGKRKWHEKFAAQRAPKR